MAWNGAKRWELLNQKGDDAEAEGRWDWNRIVQHDIAEDEADKEVKSSKHDYTSNNQIDLKASPLWTANQSSPESGSRDSSQSWGSTRKFIYFGTS